MELVLEKWIEPHIDTSKWEYFDLSCKVRDETDDKELHDAVEAGKRLAAIFKEPTVTPSADQRKEWGIKNVLGSPNGAMRRGWNGITISRDTIHIKNMELGQKKPVLFERHAIGGEYQAGWKEVEQELLKQFSSLRTAAKRFWLTSENLWIHAMRLWHTTIHWTM